MKGRSGIIGTGIVIAVTIGAFFLQGWLRPHTQAYAGHCVQRDGAELKHVCEFAIDMALCQREGATGKNTDPCARQRLEAGAVFTAYPEGLRTGEPYTMACKAPFPPAWRQSSSNSALWRKGCGRAPAS